MGSKKSWNDRNQRNYERYFGDQYDKPGTTSKPNYNSSSSSSSRRDNSGMPSFGGNPTYRNRRRYNSPFGRRRRIPGIAVAAIAVLLVVSGITSIFRGHSSGQSNNSYNSVGTYEIGVKSSVTYKSTEKSYSTCIGDPSCIPAYDGYDYVVINNGMPNFTQWDYSNIKGQNFTKLDRYGRCGTAVAMLDRSMMPTEERGSIGEVKPTGWVQNKYEGIVNSTPPYLYNRCHLIAYALTGENANELNLITGTRYMNSNVMLSWEEQVMRYLDNSSNHVLYRITPYFEGKNLLATGVEMEAYSIEDNGAGVCYHVFIYNVQPGIGIDYSTGENWALK